MIDFLLKAPFTVYF